MRTIKTTEMLLFAAPTIIDNLLLKFFSEQTVNFVIWPFIQIGLVVVLTTGWVAYATLGVYAGATRTDARWAMGIAAANR